MVPGPTMLGVVKAVGRSTGDPFEPSPWALPPGAAQMILALLLISAKIVRSAAERCATYASISARVGVSDVKRGSKREASHSRPAREPQAAIGWPKKKGVFLWQCGADARSILSGDQLGKRQLADPASWQHMLLRRGAVPLLRGHAAPTAARLACACGPRAAQGAAATAGAGAAALATLTLHSNTPAQAEAAPQPCPTPLVGVWVQDMATCDSMGPFLGGLGVPWFVWPIVDTLHTALHITSPTVRACILYTQSAKRA